MNYREQTFARGPRLLLGLVLLAGILIYGYFFGERVISGTVVDAYTKHPVRGAIIAMRAPGFALQATPAASSTQQTPAKQAFNIVPLDRLLDPAVNHSFTTEEDGKFRLLGFQSLRSLPGPLLEIAQALRLPMDAAPSVLVVKAPGYATGEVMMYDDATIQVQLRPNTLTGVIYEDGTNLPVANAFVSLGDNTTHTDKNGIFKLPNMPAQAILDIRAPGYVARQVAFDRRTIVSISMKPFIARGVYVPYYTMQSGPQTRALIDKVAASGLNTIVVDAKSERGLLSYSSSVPAVKTAKADADQEIYGLDKIVERAHNEHLYVIARICVFKDITYATSRPDLALRDSRNGQVWFENEETAWLDPYKKENWDYVISIAKEVAQHGVDEIQFDYIRFPGGTVPPYVHYSQDNTEENRRGYLNMFLSQARQALLPYNVSLSADVFGFTTLYANELGVGQRIDEYGQHMDFVSPMLYPSTFGDDDPKFENPPFPTGHPYELIKLCLDTANQRLERNPVKLRPWLQDYPDGKFDQPFGAPQLQAEIQAAEDAKSHGWLLWNPFGEYHWDVATQMVKQYGGD